MSTRGVVVILVAVAAIAAVAMFSRRQAGSSNKVVTTPDGPGEGTARSLRDALPRVFPRLVLPAFVQGAGAGLVRRPVAGTGLLSVYCIDGKDTVAFIPEDSLASAGMDVEGLHARALSNLAARTPGAVRSAVRSAVDENQLSVLKTFDTFDAARLLLVPSELREGESVVATLPDRDTLSLMGPVAPEHRDRVIELARKIARDPDRALLDVPVIVRASGFELMRSAP